MAPPLTTPIGRWSFESDMGSTTGAADVKDMDFYFTVLLKNKVMEM